MNSKEIFNGFSAETFRFLLEIGFNNNADWFEANRRRYEQFVRDPMRRLAAALMPTALDIDGNFNPSINASVSRIRRDTRFTKDKSPYRDHMWIGFRYPRTRISEGCTLWFEITPHRYDYGCGFYSSTPAFMAAYRKKIFAAPMKFLELAHSLEARGFIYSCESYRRDRFPDAPAELKPYLNVKTFAWMKTIPGVGALIAPSNILDVLTDEFSALAPMYHFLRSVISESV